MTNNLLTKTCELALRSLVRSRGFTLIETMVAILLLSTAIAGPLTIASKGLTSSVTAKDQIGAFNLAQDGMEYVRFIRDTNRLLGGNWLTGGVANSVDLTPCVSASGCYIDSLQSTITACTTTCPVLNYDSTNHYYSYTTGTASPQKYRRTITITTPVGSNSDEANVRVVVQWTSAGNITRSVTVQENMLNWQ